MVSGCSLNYLSIGDRDRDQQPGYTENPTNIHYFCITALTACSSEHMPAVCSTKMLIQPT